MKVDTSEKRALQDHINRLNDQLRRTAKVKEKELENTKNFYEARKQNLKDQGETDVYLAREQNKIEVANALQEKQKVLDIHKDSLKKTQNLLQKEQDIIQSKHKASLKDLQDDFTIKVADKLEDVRLNSLEMDARVKNEMKQVALDTQRKLDNKKLEFADSVRAKDQELSRRLESQNVQGLQQLKSKKAEFAKLEGLERLAHDRTMTKIKNENFMEISHHKGMHEKSLAQEKEQYQALLKQQRENFKKKFENMVKQHDAMMKRAEGQFNEELKAIVRSQTAAKGNLIERSDDPFYNVKVINPKIKDMGDSYNVAIEIPKYEKESVMLTAHDRRVKITVTRQFGKSVDLEDGSHNTSKRSEIFTKVVDVPEIIDSTKISQKYEDGHLHFRIAKA